ncbi:Fcf2-domain-containing protein [Xylariomycetidae sp. FL2044]|nr:Fcf2-domain-containing protein [Xylariomycetidae sp. FL2044]
MADTAVDLSDDQIERLLQEAETRLLAKQQESGAEKSLVATSQPELLKVVKPETTKSETATTAAASTASKPESGELSVRIPEPRKPKKDMIQSDAGPGWFGLGKTPNDPEVKRQFQLLRMRDVLDPKRHYKKFDTKAAMPEYSAVGTIMPGPTDFFNDQMTKKERKRTLLDEVLEGEQSSKRFKRKYSEIQAAKTSGKKGHYKKMTEKRYGRKG